jgi:hypothetical protein
MAQIGLCFLVVLGNDFVASAVIAKRFTKRNVHINRQGSVFVTYALSAHIERLVKIRLRRSLDKPIGCGIRRVTGPWYVKTREQFGRQKGHTAFSKAVIFRSFVYSAFSGPL